MEVSTEDLCYAAYSMRWVFEKYLEKLSEFLGLINSLPKVYEEMDLPGGYEACTGLIIAEAKLIAEHSVVLDALTSYGSFEALWKSMAYFNAVANADEDEEPLGF